VSFSVEGSKLGCTQHDSIATAEYLFSSGEPNPIHVVLNSASRALDATTSAMGVAVAEGNS